MVIMQGSVEDEEIIYEILDFYSLLEMEVIDF